MPRVKKDKDQNITLPADFLERRGQLAPREYWLDEREGSLLLHPRVPDVKKLYIEATTGCNLQCTTCIRNEWSDPLAPMKKATFDKILASLDGLPDVKRVVFTGFGEPLTHPNILKMIAAIQERNIDITLGTNGLLLKPATIEELVRLGVDRVMISIDGGESETYASIRGALLEQVLHSIRELNQKKAELKSLVPALGVEFVVMKSNQAELGQLVDLAKQMNISRILVSNVLPYSKQMLDEKLYTHQPVEPFKSSGWALRSDAWVTWATMELPRMHWGAERKCKFVTDNAVVIGWDGKVTPCYALSHNYSYFAIDGVQKKVSRYILGDVNEQSIADIWMSEEYTRFRSDVRCYYFPSCPDCDLRETCDLRKLNEGCWGWNPSCADCLWSQDIVKCP
jgi:Fe-coproporphyrin III synthase